MTGIIPTALKKYLVLSYFNIKNFNISNKNWDYSEDEYWKKDRWLSLENFDNVLKLFVADINKELDLENIYNEKHAKMINDFILNNDFDEILVHCALGISRSPAVMAYIALILDDKKMFNDILNEKHFIPNKLILRKSMEYDYIIKKDNREKISRNKFSEYKDITEYDPITKTITFRL